MTQEELDEFMVRVDRAIAQVGLPVAIGASAIAPLFLDLQWAIAVVFSLSVISVKIKYDWNKKNERKERTTE